NYIGFYYYNNAKYNLGELANEYISVAFDTIYSDTNIRKFISSVNDFDQNYRYTLYSSKVAALKFNKPKTCEEISDIIFTLKKNPIIEYAHYTMKTNVCQNYIMQPIGKLCVNSYSNYFYVKVFDENNLTDLHKIIAETKTELVLQDQFMPQWFVLKATKNSKGDGLKMANYFYESKLFVTAEPDAALKFPVE
ncbi:MAG: in-like serine protease, partial [Chitinophagaceae bacterium]|nr:in-like serine protease [Chitinophagaceae bacterium]